MPTNEILPFGLGGGALVTAQSAWAALTARTNGFTTGVAQPDQVNKALRQSLFVASVLAQWCADQTGSNVLDNGDTAALEALLSGGVDHRISLAVSGVYATVAALNAEANARASADSNEASVRATQDANEANARAAAVSVLNSSIVAEANARAASDASITAPFAFAYAGNGGYMKFYNGNIIQFGNQAIPTGAGDYVPFPIVFPVNCNRVVASDGGTGCVITGQGAVSQSGISAYAKDFNGAPVAVNFSFVAFGY